MDGKRFDDTTRSIFRNRRGVLTGSAALALAGALSALPRSVEAAKKKPKKKPKKPALKSAFTCAPSDVDDLVFFGIFDRFAQSFTASRSGTLREIRVLINKDASGGDYVVQLVRMEGNLPSRNPFDVLAAATIPDEEVPFGDATLVAKFAATRLEQGTSYAVVVNRFGFELAIPVPTGDSCADTEMSNSSLGATFANLDPARDMTVSVLVA